MVKVRVGARLKVAVSGGDTAKVPLSAEQVELSISYKSFCKKLQNLIKHVKANHEAMLVISQTTEAVAHDMASLSQETPLFEPVGRSNPQAAEQAVAAAAAKAAATIEEEKEDDKDTEDDDEAEGADHNDEAKEVISEYTEDVYTDNGQDMSEIPRQDSDEDDDDTALPPPPPPPPPPNNKDDTIDESSTLANSLSPASYLSIHQVWASKARLNRATYGKLVLDYVVQWENVVTTRINADLKTAEHLRVELIHYQTKVDALQKTVTSIEQKGKQPKDDLVLKLQRNTVKCKETRQQYDEFVTNMCMLLDEVVNRSWRDLQPLVLELARLDIQFSAEQAKTLNALKHIVTQIKRGQGSFLPRFKDLETKPPREISTAPGNRGGNNMRGAGGGGGGGGSITSVDTDSLPAALGSPIRVVEYENEEGKVVERVSEQPQLFIACATGDDDWLRHFLKSNADFVDERDEEGLTPLCIAARCGHANCVELLLKYGADVNATDNVGSTALHHTSEKGSHECVRLLLEAKAGIDTIDGDGFSPVHLASEHGHPQVLQQLINYQASIDQANPEGWRPVHVAAQNGRSECLQMLTRAGANLKKLRGDKWTALHLAATHGFADCCKVLIVTGGVDVDVTDQAGCTPLQKAAEKGHIECVGVLLKYKANPNLMDNEGYTPLISSALEGNSEIMKLLLSHRADVNKAHPDGWTPLHLSADYGYEECVNVLLSHKADIHRKNTDGWTALHKAAEQGQEGCLNILLDRGADIEAPNTDGFTPLHVAAFNGHVNCVLALLDLGAYVDEQDAGGCTPLYWAASEGRYDCLKLLVERGASTLLTDQEGTSAAMVAEQNGHMDCIDLLR